MARFVYSVVVGDETDEFPMRRDDAVEIGDVVPFRDRNAVVERIEDRGERAAWGGDVSEGVEGDPSTEIARTLHCRLADS